MKTPPKVFLSLVEDKAISFMPPFATPLAPKIADDVEMHENIPTVVEKAAQVAGEKFQIDYNEVASIVSDIAGVQDLTVASYARRFAAAKAKSKSKEAKTKGKAQSTLPLRVLRFASTGTLLSPI